MRSIIAFSVSVAVTAAVLGGLQWSATHAPLPAGEVIVVQLPTDADLAVYADASQAAAAESRL